MVWKQRDLKKNARNSFRTNYQRMVAVCFIIAMFTTAYASSTTFIQQLPGKYTASMQSDPEAARASEPNSAIIEDTLQYLFDFSSADDFFTNMIDRLIDIYSSNLSLVFSSLQTLNTLFYESLSPAFFLFPSVSCSFLQIDEVVEM